MGRSRAGVPGGSAGPSGRGTDGAWQLRRREPAGVTREGLAASGRRVIGLRLTRGEVWWIGSKGWHPPERQSGREDRPLGIVILDVDA